MENTVGATAEGLRLLVLFLGPYSDRLVVANTLSSAAGGLVSLFEAVTVQRRQIN